jgi:CO/xanthine dehydrogenase Mo-binding subunit
MTATRVLGHSLPRMDAPDKVSGTAVYAADFALPGMLYGKVLRSGEPHARLVRIDVSRAARIPGVRAVITAADIPDVRYGGSVRDETVFARDRIRFAGQPLAAIAATAADVATQARAAIDRSLINI